jgi:hypothetical protein
MRFRREHWLAPSVKPYVFVEALAYRLVQAEAVLAVRLGVRTLTGHWASLRIGRCQATRMVVLVIAASSRAPVLACLLTNMAMVGCGHQLANSWGCGAVASHACSTCIETWSRWPGTPASTRGVST